MNLSAIKKATSGKTRTGGISDFAELELSKVYANLDQPRKEFNDEDISELAMAIQSDGLLQPIVVVKRDDGYMIVSGERRYRAHLWLEAKTIKTHIINVDDSKVLELALIENIQREDLTDFEVAVHVSKLWASGNYETKLHLSSALGKSSSYLSKAFSCLKLDKSIIDDIQENKRDIGLSVLDEMARVKDTAMQKDVYRMYLSGFITRDGIAEYRDLKIESEYSEPVVKPKVKKTVTKKEEEKSTCKWFNSTKGTKWSHFLTECGKQHSFHDPELTVNYSGLKYCPYCSKKIIGAENDGKDFGDFSNTRMQERDSFKKAIWTIEKNILNENGFDYETIIMFSNATGVSLPDSFEPYEDKKDTKYKITIEEI